MGYIINEQNTLNTGSSLVPVLIPGAGGPYIIPAGYAIRRIYAQISTGSNNLTCGNTDGATDLIDATPLAGGTVVAIDTTIIAFTDRTIYFNIDTIDETIQTFLTIYLDKIKT
jgi:hypothetical protein